MADKGNESKSFKKKFLAFLDRSVESSKKAVKKAGKKISDFGDKSVLTIEITQLKSKLSEKYELLGKLCFEKLTEKKTLSSASRDVEEFISEIKKIQDNIEKRKLQLKKKPESSDETVEEKSESEKKSAKRSSSARKAVASAVKKSSSSSKKTSAVKPAGSAGRTASKKITAKKTAVKSKKNTSPVKKPAVSPSDKTIVAD